jgi:dipeptidyl-peptidase 4
MTRGVRRLAASILVAAACADRPPMREAPIWPDVDDGYITQLAATYSFRLGHPQEVTVAPDGDVLFTRTEPRGFVAALYERDHATGEVTRLLDVAGLLDGADEAVSAEERARRERLRQATRGISGYGLSRDGTRLLVPVSDRLFVVDRASGSSRELATGAGFPYDPRLAPAGDRVAYVIDGDLWVAPTSGAAPRRLTTRASPEIEHGVAEFVAQEEMDRTRGYWWSPDGQRIAYQRTDLAPVEVLHVADPAHPDRTPIGFRYPRAGTANAIVTLGVIAADGGDTTWIDWDRGRWPYLCRVVWDDGAPLTLVVMNRAQTELAVLAADADRGTTRVLLTETDDAWLNLEPHLPRWIGDGAGLVWATERNGALQVELRLPDGALARALTPVELGLQKVAGIDVEAGLVWVEASTDPIQTHVWAVPIAGGAPRAVTTEDGVHTATVAGRGGRVVVTSRPRSGGLRVEVRGPDGGVIAVLPSVAEEPPAQPAVEWTTVTIDDRVHHASIVRPRGFDPARRYPVLLRVYGGPHKRVVEATPRSFLLDQWYADAGFVVVATDGRGTPYRGRAWERAIHRDLITVPMADQIAVLRALAARHPELDLERVGVHGWSFGGYVAAMAVLLHGDVFRAAIAGAPVTDWALYDTFYTERYMQTPDDNPQGYRATSAITHAARLDRPLLVIHGTTDDNVHFAHSLALVEAAFRAGKTIELVPVSATHMTPDPVVARALHRRQLDFFRTHLGGLR